MMRAVYWWDGIAQAGWSKPLVGDVTCDVAVIGLGGSGLRALTELARRSVRAVGIDAGAVAAGAAGRNGGFLLAGLADFHHVAVERHGRARAAACYLETLDELGRIFEESPLATRRNGSLRIASSAEELADCRRHYDEMVADGLPVEWYRGPVGEGLRFASDGSMQPAIRCQQLAEAVHAAGARLYTDSPVTAIGAGSVRTATGSVSCEAVLVLVDGGLDMLVPELAPSVRSARLQMLATAPLSERVADCPVYCRYGLDYWQQSDSGELVLGGGRDVGGADEWTTLAEPTAPVQGALDDLARRVVETSGRASSRPVVTHRWAGIVGYTPSGLPLVRGVGDGVFVAGGYCGTGNVIGSIAGRALVELAVDGSSRLAELFDAPGG